jgi:hypothetical protein
MWISWNERILLGTYKIMLMILLSHICQFSNLIAYQFLNKLTCAILMKLQKKSFFCHISFFVILVAFLKASQLSSFPCWYLWYLWYVGGCSWSIYNKINWASGHALKAKISLVYCLTLFWISCSIISIYFVCTCFFVIIIFMMLST